MSDTVVQVVPVRFGDVTVQVEATRVAGTERTSALGDRAAAAYHDAEHAILAVAKSVAATIATMKDAAGELLSPREVTVEFGVNVSVEGNAVLVKGTTGAMLKVTLTYDSTG